MDDIRERGALDILEEALHVLRQASIGTILVRLAGDLPFTLGWLYFATDMTRNPFAAERLPGESLALTALFISKSFWQGLFMVRLHRQLSPDAVIAQTTTAPGITRLLVMQACLQPWALLVLPVLSLATIPFAWGVAFFRNVTLMAALGDKDAVGNAYTQARLWTRQNWQILGIVSLGGLLLFANILIALVLVPEMARSFLGLEGDFTRLGMRILNGTTLSIALAITWLLIDPLLDSVYVVRCFYGASQRSGADLRARFKELTAKLATAALLLVLVPVLLTIPAGNLSAQSTSSQNQKIDPSRLDESINRTIRQPEFAWRTPRPEGPQPQGKWVDWTRSVLQMISGAFDWVSEKLSKLFRRNLAVSDDTPAGSSTFSLQAGMIIIGVVLVGAFVAAWLRMRRQKPLQAQAVTVAAAVPVDLNDESVSADQMTADSWRTLAAELSQSGEHRKALRALYLAGLNYLSTRELISLQRWKSGLDYRRELERRMRAHAEVRPELANVVTQNIALFELGWYGRRAVGHQDVEEFLSGLDAMRKYAEPQ